MPTLPELVSDLDAMLAMTPAELGPHVMRAAEGLLQNGKVHPNNILDPTLLYGRGIPTGRPIYPAGREREVERAVREALGWLGQNGFTVAADANGWIMFTRLGENFLHPPPAQPPPAGADATPFDRFEARQTRRLRARVHDVDVELNRLHREAIKAGVADGNRTIFGKLAAVEQEAREATDAVLVEATALTANKGNTRTLWVEETAERARSVLLAHVEALYALNWRMDPDLLHTVKGSIDSSRNRTVAMVNDEVDDFAGGVWHPNSPPRAGEPSAAASEAAASAILPQGQSVGIAAAPSGGAPIARGGAFNSHPFNTSTFNAGANPSMFRDTDENGVALNVTSGQELNLSSEPIVSTFGSNDGLSGTVGGTPLNTLAVNVGSGPSAGTATTVSMSGAARAALTGRAILSISPPEVPEPGPALIEPEWVEGRLTLPKGLPANDLGDQAVVDLLAAVRAGFVEFIEALARSGTNNFDPAARRAIEGVPELLSGAPDQVRVFQMGHAVERLEALQSVVDEELAEALRVQYGALVGQFRRLVERFPAWRALTLKAKGEPLTQEQAQQAVPVARELAAALSTEAAAEVADPDIADALFGLADAAEGAGGAERALLDFDLVASVNQIMTALMKPVLYCWNEYGAGAREELKKIPREFGAGTVKWGKRTLLAIAALRFGAIPLAALAAHLAAIYPTLSWLPAVVECVKYIAALPQG